LNGKIEYNPAADLRKVLPTVKHTHMAAPTDPKEVIPLLRAIDAFDGSFVVKCALRIAPLVFVRPGELRKAEWSEIDLEAATWNIPGEKMKMKQAHIVPLSRQVVAILKELHPLTGHGKYVFTCRRSPLNCMSENTINASLRRMGFDKAEITGHGFRAMARTMLHEILQFTPDAIEAQLAHIVPDRLGRAYNRTSHLAERKRMMQTWADYLDGLKAGAKVIPLPFDRTA
jgi:integrase